AVRQPELFPRLQSLLSAGRVREERPRSESTAGCSTVRAWASAASPARSSREAIDHASAEIAVLAALEIRHRLLQRDRDRRIRGVHHLPQHPPNQGVVPRLQDAGRCASLRSLLPLVRTAPPAEAHLMPPLLPKPRRP